MSISRRKLSQFLKYAALFKAGGICYGAMEMIYRGRTHWSMITVGGICTVMIYIVAVKSTEPIWKKCIMCGAIITTIEFLTGIIVNIVLGLKVWNYANSFANLFGQICLMYSLLWMLLSIPALWLMKKVGRHIFGDIKGGC